MVKNLLYVIVVIALIGQSCNCSSDNQQANTVFQAVDSSAVEGALVIDKSAMENLVQNIGSPVEMAELIKSLGAPSKLRTTILLP